MNTAIMNNSPSTYGTYSDEYEDEYEYRYQVDYEYE